MKPLIGLCALLFAGHAMAVCNTAALSGSYKGMTHGDIPGVVGVVKFNSIATAKLNGDGTGTADIYSMAAGVPIVASAQPITYTVVNPTDGSTNCLFQINVTYAGLITLSYKGYMGSDGKEIYVISNTAGTNIDGTVVKTN